MTFPFFIPFTLMSWIRQNSRRSSTLKWDRMVSALRPGTSCSIGHKSVPGIVPSFNTISTFPLFEGVGVTDGEGGGGVMKSPPTPPADLFRLSPLSPLASSGSGERWKTFCWILSIWENSVREGGEREIQGKRVRKT